jgi:TPR repeat protein
MEKAYWAFRNAAEKGHISAQHNLAVMYNTGTHVTKDPTAAATWFAKAAESGHAGAAFNLAHLFLTGSGVEQDNQKAHSYLCIAADNGHADALEYVQKFLASKGLDKNGNPMQ